MTRKPHNQGHPKLSRKKLEESIPPPGVHDSTFSIEPPTRFELRRYHGNPEYIGKERSLKEVLKDIRKEIG